MYLHCLGISHNTANTHLREILAFTPARIECELTQFANGDIVLEKPIQEIVILSTCNRVEIYAAASEPAFEAIIEFLAEVSGVSPTDFSQHTYRLLGEEAVAHLMRVAAGLDSLVLGEPQILGQVSEALAIAQCSGSAGNLLSRLFQAAIHAGKRARTETSISHNPASVASVAVMLISQTVDDLTTSQIAVLGAGEMAELAVETLIKRGAVNITVVNRTLKRAQQLAQRWGGKTASFDALPNLLPDTDILITSTGAPHTIVHPHLIAPAIEERPERPMVIMDIAVPRDVDPEVAEIPNVSLFDMDMLSSNLEESLAKRMEEVPQVEAILKEEEVEFREYLATLDMVPIIIEMRERANQIRQAEVAKSIRRMRELSPEEQKHIDALTKSIVSKILHSPTTKLKSEANGPNATDYANVTRSLFGLD